MTARDWLVAYWPILWPYLVGMGFAALSVGAILHVGGVAGNVLAQLLLPGPAVWIALRLARRPIGDADRAVDSYLWALAICVLIWSQAGPSSILVGWSDGALSLGAASAPAFAIFVLLVVYPVAVAVLSIVAVVIRAALGLYDEPNVEVEERDAS